MKNYTYHFEVESLVAQFMAALDDIIIKRYDKTGGTDADAVKVRMVYSPKQRVVSDLIDKAQNTQLPVVCVSLGGVARDTGRVYNKLDGSPFKINPNQTHIQGFLPQPLPVDITVNVDFITKYQKDIDQIITNFVPYCDPYFIISWRITDLQDHEIRSVVQWSGNVNITYPNDLAASTNARVVGSTTFTIKGWLFRPVATSPLIFDITTTFNGISSLSQRYNFEELEETVQNYDTFVIHGVSKPKNITIKSIYPQAVRNNVEKQQITVLGDMFKNIKAVYLSGGPLTESSSYIQPFSSSERLSAEFPGINAHPIPSEDVLVLNEYTMLVNLPLITSTGYFDIIVQNPAGYTTLIYNINKTIGSYPNDTRPLPLSRGVKVVNY